jgi:hypothetical protein
MPKYNIEGEALELLDHFIHYAEIYPDGMASVMYYDIDAFKYRVKELKKAISKEVK